MSAPEVSSKPEIDIVPATMAEDQRLVGEITDLTNSVYAVAEAGLWVEGAARTTTAEVAEMIAGEEITLARVDGIGYRPVGTGNFEQSYPQLEPLLATPCDFVIYHKPLTVGARA